jgi:hypothetical protein
MRPTVLHLLWLGTAILAAPMPLPAPRSILYSSPSASNASSSGLDGAAQVGAALIAQDTVRSIRKRAPIATGLWKLTSFLPRNPWASAAGSKAPPTDNPWEVYHNEHSGFIQYITDRQIGKEYNILRALAPRKGSFTTMFDTSNHGTDERAHYIACIYTFLEHGRGYKAMNSFQPWDVDYFSILYSADHDSARILMGDRKKHLDQQTQYDSKAWAAVDDHFGESDHIIVTLNPRDVGYRETLWNLEHGRAGYQVRIPAPNPDGETKYSIRMERWQLPEGKGYHYIVGFPIYKSTKPSSDS